MRVHTKKTVPREITVLTEITCDLCRTVTTTDWKESCFDATESEIRLETGSNWPEGGSGARITIDICPNCFKKKLIPWVKEQGGEPTIKEWDW